MGLEIRPEETPEELRELAKCLSGGTALIDTYIHNTHDTHTYAFAFKDVTIFNM